jgi:hypothetical protein
MVGRRILVTALAAVPFAASVLLWWCLMRPSPIEEFSRLGPIGVIGLIVLTSTVAGPVSSKILQPTPFARTDHPVFMLALTIGAAFGVLACATGLIAWFVLPGVRAGLSAGRVVMGCLVGGSLSCVYCLLIPRLARLRQP